MTLLPVETRRAEILEWRERERKKLCDLIDERLSELDALIVEKIDQMGFMDTLNRTDFHDKEVAPAVEAWLRAQCEDLRRNIEESAVQLKKLVTGEHADHSWGVDEIVGKGLATAAILVPIATIPFAVTLATVTTTSFFVFTTSAVSIPILTAVVAGLTVTGGGTVVVQQKVFGYFNDKYRQQALAEARAKVIGTTGADNELSLRNLLSNEIDKIAISRLEAIK